MGNFCSSDVAPDVNHPPSPYRRTPETQPISLADEERDAYRDSAQDQKRQECDGRRQEQQGKQNVMQQQEREERQERQERQQQQQQQQHRQQPLPQQQPLQPQPPHHLPEPLVPSHTPSLSHPTTTATVTIATTARTPSTSFKPPSSVLSFINQNNNNRNNNKQSRQEVQDWSLSNLALAHTNEEINNGMQTVASPLSIACEHGHSDIMELLSQTTKKQNQNQKRQDSELAGTYESEEEEGGGDNSVQHVLLETTDIDIDNNNNNNNNNNDTDICTTTTLKSTNKWVAPDNILKNEVKDVFAVEKQKQHNKGSNADNSPNANTTTGKRRPSLLLKSSRKGNVQTVRKLLEKEVHRVNETNEEGQTALHHACSYGRLDVVKMLISANGVDVNQPTKEGSTPLHDAVENGYYNVVKALLQAPNIQLDVIANGKTPLELALEEEEDEIVFLLEKYGATSSIE